MKLAIFYGNRGFFPGEVIASAREEMRCAVEKAGFEPLEMDASLTRYGAVETIAEGKQYAAFLEAHRGEFDGVVVCLPNFGDENGAYYALKDAGVPILIQAYPDEIGKMDFAHRRDAVCGKIAMCNVLRQAGIPYTLTKQFAAHPDSAALAEDLRLFGGVCRAVKGLKHFTVGAIGARTTAFKTVRVDEIAFQRKHINVETVDLSEVFALMDNAESEKIEAKKKALTDLSDFGKFKGEKLENIARLGVALDTLIDRYGLDSIAIRCWDELQKKYAIAPCVLLSELNGKGIPAACELDVNNAVMMQAMACASGEPVMLFDVNNNYGEDKKKVVLFHCGPAPSNMMKSKGHIEEHLMFKKTYGEGSGVGLNVGDIIATETTLGSMKTEDGELWSFVTEGKLTEDEIEKAFFGCGTVFEKKEGGADDLLNYMATEGYRHHVAIAKGYWGAAVKEAFEKYLGFEIEMV